MGHADVEMTYVHRVARSQQLDVTDIEDAAQRVRAYVARIATA